MIHRLIREQFVPGDPATLWAFFASPHNLTKITPPNMAFQIIGGVSPRMYAGQMIEYRVGVMPGIRLRWLTEITHVAEGEYFVDEQRIGPYRLWHHEHLFTESADGNGVSMTDRVTYDVGWGWAGEVMHALWIRRQLEKIFDYRIQRVNELFAPKKEA